jgi:hypothetical protein
MSRTMACGICSEDGHRRETCPKRETAAGAKAARTCGGCKRADGTHAPKCRRGHGPAPPPKSARRAESAPAPPNGAGRYADAIAAMEAEASRLEADANVLRQAVKGLRTLA